MPNDDPRGERQSRRRQPVDRVRPTYSSTAATPRSRERTRGSSAAPRDATPIRTGSRHWGVETRAESGQAKGSPTSLPGTPRAGVYGDTRCPGRAAAGAARGVTSPSRDLEPRARSLQTNLTPARHGSDHAAHGGFKRSLQRLSGRRAMGTMRQAWDRAARPRFDRRVVRRWRGWSIVSGSGWRSLAGFERGRGCRCGGVGAGWCPLVSRGWRDAVGQLAPRRAGTCRSRSVRRSRCCARPVRGWRDRASLGRSPSTISRELRRNAATRGGRFEYRATAAQWHADRRGRRPKPAKLAMNLQLWRYVQERLRGP